MGRVILLVVVVLLVIAYGGLFLSWNMGTVPVTGWAWGGQGLVEDAPLGFLILGGVIVGAIVMAAFTFGAYQAQRRRCAESQAMLEQAKKKLGLAKVKVDELVAKVKEQREKLEKLEKGGEINGRRGRRPRRRSRRWRRRRKRKLVWGRTRKVWRGGAGKPGGGGKRP